jgi:CspA family cold shock protein
MPTGTVKWCNTSKGFGFITPDDGDEDLFFITRELPDSISENQRVAFEVLTGPKGKMAANVQII